MDSESETGPSHEVLERRAHLCRQQARKTENPSLAEAFNELADALEIAAAVAQSRAHHLLH